MPTPCGRTGTTLRGDMPVDYALHLSLRIHRLRTLGLGLGFLCVAAVFREQGAHPALWALLVVHGFLWSHVACGLEIRSPDPRKTELRSLMTDSFLGGVWVALMGFNTLPSVLLVTMLAMDKIAVGSGRLPVRTRQLTERRSRLPSVPRRVPPRDQRGDARSLAEGLRKGIRDIGTAARYGAASLPSSRRRPISSRRYGRRSGWGNRPSRRRSRPSRTCGSRSALAPPDREIRPASRVAGSPRPMLPSTRQRRPAAIS